MSKKILFITTVNLWTNPRILKEIKLAHSLNYEISFLGFSLGNRSDEMDREIREQITDPRYLYLDASRKKYLRWLRHSLLERFNRIIWKLNKSNLFLAATACTKRTFSLLDFGKGVSTGDFDLVIGHTLGALYPASVIAGKAGCPFGFDVEDYHPGEHIDGNEKDEIRRRKLIMKRILPRADYVSASSPLIGSLTKELCGLDEKKIILVFNFFPILEFKTPVGRGGRKIKLIWFSQFIGPGRGLEIILSGWDSLKENFELTLIGSSGSWSDGISRKGIIVTPPLLQPELHALLGQYDVGLALELTNRDLNKDSALSNKMLAYYQAGLYIIATDTTAQKDFIDKRPDSGKLFLQSDMVSFLTTMTDVLENIDQIRAGSLKRYQDAAAHSWENESYKLKTVWEASLN